MYRLFLIFVPLLLMLNGCTTQMIVTTVPQEDVEFTGAWVRDVEGKKGTIEGFYFSKDGALHTINIFSMEGDRYDLDGNKLTLWTFTERYPEPTDKQFIIDTLTLDTLILKNGTRSEKYRRPLANTDLLKTKWVATYVPGAQQLNGDNDPPSMRFVDEGKVEGFSGCNSFFSSFKIEAENIHFGPLASTRMFCPEMEYEMTFQKALAEAEKYIIVQNQLFIFGEKKLVAVFVASTT